MSTPRFTFLGLVSLVPVTGFVILTVFAIISYLAGGHWPGPNVSPAFAVKPPGLSAVMSPISVALVFMLPISACLIVAFRGRTEVGWRQWHNWAVGVGSLLCAYQLLRLGGWIWD